MPSTVHDACFDLLLIACTCQPRFLERRDDREKVANFNGGVNLGKFGEKTRKQRPLEESEVLYGEYLLL